VLDAALRAAAAAAVIGIAARAAADPVWSVRLLGGSAWNARTELTIHQAGEPDLRFHARWKTRGLEAPPYYVVGIARRDGGREWSLELVHHKLYLQNPPPEVQDFSVSHGYNLLLVGYGLELQAGLWARLGAGAVIGHPESTVRGRPLDQTTGFLDGYHLSGAALSAGLEERISVFPWLQVILGVRATAAYAEVPVADGFARVPNVAVHATAGLAFDVLR
jgi:hypothetical protein